MHDDFFDQGTGEEDVNEVDYDDVPNDGPSIIVNGSVLPLEVGANFLQSIKSAALNAGFGKFRVMLNGTEVRPSSAPPVVEPNHRVELRPYDEAGV